MRNARVIEASTAASNEGTLHLSDSTVAEVCIVLTAGSCFVDIETHTQESVAGSPLWSGPMPYGQSPKVLEFDGLKAEKLVVKYRSLTGGGTVDVYARRGVNG